MQVLLKGLVTGFVVLATSMALGAATPAEQPALIVDSQYSASFDQGRGSWILVPPAGGVVMQQNVGRCRDDRAISPGLWLVTRDAVGRIELVAPSVTPLPAGHPERIPVLACDSSEADGLHLPRPLIDALLRDHGVVRIEG